VNAKPIGVWDFGTETDELGALEALADGRRRAPDHRVIEVTRYDRHLDVLLEAGAEASNVPGSLFYVEGRGTFRLLETLTTAAEAHTVLRLVACSVVQRREAPTAGGGMPLRATKTTDQAADQAIDQAITDALNQVAARLFTAPDELVSAAGRAALEAAEW
jgi:hypothetical protein